MEPCYRERLLSRYWGTALSLFDACSAGKTFTCFSANLNSLTPCLHFIEFINLTQLNKNIVQVERRLGLVAWL